ncbi:hypothetical protein [Rhodohalobacter barkolensis]|uniref:DUF4231 domain-containing protein n=1 Tax=Rhodohalobacter barkolensis TaxID=2053187 RepID=A0A2N0VL20_9BACT|nr:hypothetical protein [Rhodohalobacter barkolensis]PKD44897.1 hypothetical protein CWD77_05405 [Rhodohalobacter barkolensis]
MRKDDIFTAMIHEELEQHERFFLFQERELFRRKEYQKLASKSLRQTRIFAFFVLMTIAAFSLVSIMHFVEFGQQGGLSRFVLGILSWAFSIASVFFYTKNVLEKKKCMERVLKLLEAREQFYDTAGNP